MLRHGVVQCTYDGHDNDRDRLCGAPMADESSDAANALAKLIEAGQDALRQFTMSLAFDGAGDSQLNAVSKSFADLHQSYIQQMTKLWTAMLGAGGQASGDVRQEDKRFASEAWRSDPRFDVLKRTYLAYSDFLQNSVEAAPVDERTRGQMRFAVRQFVDAMSPANVFATNPEAMQLAMQSGGQSLSEGLRLFFDDLGKGRVAMTDESAFEVGKNLAVSKGAVIFENELIQVMQYAPATAEVY